MIRQTVPLPSVEKVKPVPVPVSRPPRPYADNKVTSSGAREPRPAWGEASPHISDEYVLYMKMYEIF